MLGLGLRGLSLGQRGGGGFSYAIPSGITSIAALKTASALYDADAADWSGAAVWQADNPGFTSAEFLARFPRWPFLTDGQTPALFGDTVGFEIDQASGGLRSLGPNLIDSDGWTEGTGWSVTDGVATHTGTTSGNLTQGVLTQGSLYRMTSAISGGTCHVYAGSSSYLFDQSGAFSALMVCASSTQAIYQTDDDGVTVTGAAARLVPGYHAAQATSGNRPILARHPAGGVRNLLNDSENPADWSGNLGSLTWDGNTVSNAGGLAFLRQPYSGAPSSGAYAVNFRLIGGTTRWVLLYSRANGSNVSRYFDMQTGTLGTASGTATWAATAAEGGGWDVVVEATAGASGESFVQVQWAEGDANLGVPSGSLEMVRAHVEAGTFDGYQTRVDQYDVMEGGVGFVGLIFDGGKTISTTPPAGDYTWALGGPSGWSYTDATISGPALRPTTFAQQVFLCKPELIDIEKDILEGDVAGSDVDIFLLAGQSNMRGNDTFDSGTGFPAAAYQLTQENTLAAAVPMLDHNDTFAGGMSLALQFVIDYAAANPSRKIILVPRAQGSTSFAGGHWGVGDAVYLKAVSDTNTILTALPGATLRAILWHQGEHDALTTEAAIAYAAEVAAMVAGMRAGISGASSVPFICGALLQGLSAGAFPGGATVQAALADVPNQISNSAHVSSVSLTDLGDGVHFDAASLRTLGSRYYTAFAAL